MYSGLDFYSIIVIGRTRYLSKIFALGVKTCNSKAVLLMVGVLRKP
jgi:hypothetical protein